MAALLSKISILKAWRNRLEFLDEFTDIADIVDRHLANYMFRADVPQKTIYEAMEYSLMSKGKRIRPVLCISTCRMLNGNEIDVIPFACAIEMIHTYSLIHDDLPAMDNDDYRRGKLTNHKVFGEAIAILAGDALLNKAFEIMSDKVLYNENNNMLRAMNEIVRSSGTQGMIGGQIIDIESEAKHIDTNLLNYMHACKTGALIKASVLASAYICNASEQQIANLDKYSQNIGLAFQIKDDILNVEGDATKTGKSVGSDLNRKKATFIAAYGIEKAKRILNDTIQNAIYSLDVFGEKGEFLKQLALFIAHREN